MVVCKYFLQGTCKFGSNCYNEHQTPSTNTNFSSTSILRQGCNFGNPVVQPDKPANSVDANALVKTVVNDMTAAEKGGQWLLSCYAPFKEKPAFPCFEDTSPEEIRLSYYDAQKSGTIPQYIQNFQNVLQNTISKVRALQNPTQEVISILISIYNSPQSSSSGTFGISTVSNTGTPSIFGNQAPNTLPNQNTGNIFQTQQASTNIFQGNSPFQTQAQSNIFSNVSNPINQSQGNIFANQGSTNKANIFAPNQQPTNVFDSAPTQSNQNIFAPGNTTSPFSANKPSQNIFAPQPQQNIFQIQNETPPSTPPNIFAPNITVPKPSVFSTNTSVFLNSSNPLSAPTGTSIFGVPLKASQFVDESIYSKEDELSEEVKKYYQNDVFDIMSIPDVPPTYSMCFGA